MLMRLLKIATRIDSNHGSWGWILLRPCSEAVGLPAIKRWVYQPRKKNTEEVFVRFFSHLFVNNSLEIIQQKCKAAGFQNMCFFFNVYVAGNGRLNCRRV